jgi:hypothetical protein
MKQRIAKLAVAIGLAVLLLFVALLAMAWASEPPQPTSTIIADNAAIAVPPAGIPPAMAGIPHQQEASSLPVINDIVGATYDPDTDELVVIGQLIGTLPTMDYNYIQDNLLAAMRAVHSTPEYPGVTIGTTPSPDPSYQLVEYFGNITDTHYGYVFFEADRILKAYSLGKDNLHQTDPFTSSVPGYQSFFDRWIALKDTGPYPISQRFWFSPTLNLRTAPGDAHGIVFSNTVVNLNWAYIASSNTSSESTQAANEFVNHFNANYDLYAAEQAAKGNYALQELPQLFKLCGIAHWAQSDIVRLNADGINGPWLANYPIPYATTPLTTPTASRTAQFNVGGITYTVVMSGGVGTGPPATEVPEALAATIADDVINSRPEGSFAWTSGGHPDVSPTGIRASSATLVGMAFRMSENLASNSSFEAGPASAPWIQYSSGSYELITSGAGNVGSYGAYMGNYNNAIEHIYQDVAIPASAVSPRLSYYWVMFSNEPTSLGASTIDTRATDVPPFITVQQPEMLDVEPLPRQPADSGTVSTQPDDIDPAAAKDFMYVQILDTNNNVLQTLQIISNDDTRNVWQSAGFSLDAYKGQTIRVRFRVTNNASNPTGFYVDDVTLDTLNAYSPSFVYLPIILRSYVTP